MGGETGMDIWRAVRRQSGMKGFERDQPISYVHKSFGIPAGELQNLRTPVDNGGPSQAFGIATEKFHSAGLVERARLV
jgi:hypothetical protein